MLLKKRDTVPDKTIEISGSKSISNRLLVLQKLYGNIEIENLSTSEDTQILINALNSQADTIDVHHAGTAMRFLTAYFASFEGRTTILTGSERMKQRPIGFLVDSLRSLGAEIEYVESENFPPLKIVGKKLNGASVEIKAGISSQFISALLLIAPNLENGLEIKLLGEITSRPYLEMTIEILREFGINVNFSGNVISVSHFFEKSNNNTQKLKKFVVESDWSSASYWYSIASISRKQITLEKFKQNSLQGDSALVRIYKKYFGIKTKFQEDDQIVLYPVEDINSLPKPIKINMNDCPDIVQTICVTAASLKIPFQISGLSTLKIKETDRLLALKNELKKIGCFVIIDDNSITSESFTAPNDKVSIATYNDHRMAMSFAPYSFIDDIDIVDEDVVNKSYPSFWKHFNNLS